MELLIIFANEQVYLLAGGSGDDILASNQGACQGMFTVAGTFLR